jgi:hypothetical protein
MSKAAFTNLRKLFSNEKYGRQLKINFEFNEILALDISPYFILMKKAKKKKNKTKIISQITMAEIFRNFINLSKKEINSFSR